MSLSVDFSSSGCQLAPRLALFPFQRIFDGFGPPVKFRLNLLFSVLFSGLVWVNFEAPDCWLLVPASLAFPEFWCTKKEEKDEIERERRKEEKEKRRGQEEKREDVSKRGGKGVEMGRWMI